MIQMVIKYFVASLDSLSSLLSSSASDNRGISCDSELIELATAG